MQAELVLTGAELLLGINADTHTPFLADGLARVGATLARVTMVGDARDEIAAAVREALVRADAVIVTGGLGPTHDDLTAAALADACGVPVAEHPEALRLIEETMRARGRALDAIQRRQAQLPQGAVPIPNPTGIAPGIHLHAGDREVFCLPGVPGELRPMAEAYVFPHLAQLLRGVRVPLRRTLRLAGVPESQVIKSLGDRIERYQPAITILAKLGEVHLVVTAGEVAALDAFEREVVAAFPDRLFGRDGESLEEVIGKALTARKQTLALAESCTGGLLAHRITNVPGSSAYLLAGVVSYSNESKSALLGVPDDLLRAHGAVSAPVAEAMAAGARRVANATVAVSTTGIAGPTGGTPEKPVGLVYIGLADERHAQSHEYRFVRDREANKALAAQMALLHLWLWLRGTAA